MKKFMIMMSKLVGLVKQSKVIPEGLATLLCTISREDIDTDLWM